MITITCAICGGKEIVYTASEIFTPQLFHYVTYHWAVLDALHNAAINPEQFSASTRALIETLTGKKIEE